MLSRAAINERIANRVMGWTALQTAGGYWQWRDVKGKRTRMFSQWAPCEELSDAVKALEAWRAQDPARRWSIDSPAIAVHAPNDKYATVLLRGDAELCRGHSDSPAMAACLAMLDLPNKVKP